jgi:hypothetical protein
LEFLGGFLGADKGFLFLWLREAKEKDLSVDWEDKGYRIAIFFVVIKWTKALSHHLIIKVLCTFVRSKYSPGSRNIDVLSHGLSHAASPSRSLATRPSASPASPASPATSTTYIIHCSAWHTSRCSTTFAIFTNFQLLASSSDIPSTML